MLGVIKVCFMVHKWSAQAIFNLEVDAVKYILIGSFQLISLQTVLQSMNVISSAAGKTEESLMPHTVPINMSGCNYAPIYLKRANTSTIEL
jgi:hypothetical protein